MSRANAAGDSMPRLGRFPHRLSLTIRLYSTLLRSEVVMRARLHVAMLGSFVHRNVIARALQHFM
jgi:uncharacterized protein (DUF924 family)